MRHLRYFYGSFIVTLIGFALIIWLGPENKIYALYLVAVLALLEISLSFDNAVINARILKKMSYFWQQMFIWIGMPIAVFGMRLVFPLLLVDLTTSLSFTQVFHLAVNDPIAYQKALELGMPTIAAFGAGFLIMVAFKFFIAESREVLWIKPLESNPIVRRLHRYKGGHLLIPLLIAVGLFFVAPQESHNKLTLAYLLGIVIHEILGLLNHLFGHNEETNLSIAKNGLMGFLYLEVLDASFSLDGVIGAFAITRDIFIIMVGLGIGAMFVRSMTIYFVRNDTLAKFKYIEHGAHYAIGILAIVMLVKIFGHLPEWLVGGASIGIIIASVVASIKTNKATPARV